MERRNISVPKAHRGEAVARIVHDGLGVPHNTAKGLIDAGCVTINGRPVRSHGQRCEGGDVVEVRYDPERRYEERPQPRHGPGFRVVHEDLEIVVVDKTPGLLSSPAPGRREESLAELIAQSLRSRGIKRPQLFVVHRLDQHTSGLLVFARTPRAMEWLAAQFESREAGRAYSAIVQGRVERDRGTIQSWLVEDSRSLSVHTISTRGAGKRALTHFVVQERFEDATLVRVGLETGRKHQIRVHFAEIGHPVLGDRRYGDPTPTMARVALHAERLTFRHPRTLETMTFEAPWPEDLTKLVQRLRKESAGRAEDERAAHEQGAVPRAASRPGIPTSRVAVFPRGLTLTDPMGPVSAWLQGGEKEPIQGAAAGRSSHVGATRAPVARSAPSRTAPGRPYGERDQGYRPAPARGPAAQARRPAGESARPHADKAVRGDITPDRRERLLRERSVGNRPGGRRPAPRDAEAPPSKAASWKRERTHGGGQGGPREQGHRFEGSGDRDRSDRGPSVRGASRGKPWSGRARDEGAGGWRAPSRGLATSGAKRWEAKSAEKPWTGKSGDGKPGGKPWMGKPRDTKAAGGRPWLDKARGPKPDGKPWTGKPREAKGEARPWAGKPHGARTDGKPWTGKPREAKGEARPWAGKPQGARTDGKPREGKPTDAKAEARPWADKPPRPRSGVKRWEGKPRNAKAEARPWVGKPQEARTDGQPWTGKPREPGGPGGKPRDAKSWKPKPRPRAAGDERSRPWRGESGEGKPHGKRPWTGKPPSSGGAPPSGRWQAGGETAKDPHRSSGGGSAPPRKPWEFKEKGSTLRRERRRKIAAAQAKGRGKGKKQ